LKLGGLTEDGAMLQYGMLPHMAVPVSERRSLVEKWELIRHRTFRTAEYYELYHKRVQSV
jgi:hypothetical protein